VTSALLVDLYLLTMGQSYLAEGIAEEPATFSLFYRQLPDGWGYTLAAGLDDALRYLDELAFAEDDLAYLEGTGLFTAAFLERLRAFRFSGDVRAVPEGTVFWPHEPVLEVTGPIVEAQIAETMVINHVHLQTLIASKAARSVDAADGRTLVDFALRRTHGADAGLSVARASYLAGFDATSNVLAGRRFGVPIAGTMAHSHVEAFEDELSAFRAYGRAFPDRAILLVDTYDTLAGVRRAVQVGRELAALGHRLAGVRIDSGDVVELSKAARAALDEAGLGDATVFVSGGLDEDEIARLLEAGAPIGGFGVGTKLGVAANAAFLDMAYKLVEFRGRPTMKLSEGKPSLPGRKQVWRQDGFDVVGLDGEDRAGDPLLVPMMSAGRRLVSEPLAESRARARAQREGLPARQRALSAEPGEVRLSDELERLRADLAERVRS
jgi:nicotinate phosphoribosyltransferase